MTAPFDLRADIHRPQTTPFFSLVQYPPPELSYCLLYPGSNATAHIPRKLSSFCASFGAPSLAKAPAKLSWMTIRTHPPSDLKPSLAPPPPSFMCPIGHEIMCNPVSCADGHTYERAHIKRWLFSNSTSPLTGAVLPTKVVTSNHALRNLIQERQEESRCMVEVDENTPPLPWWLQFIQCAAETENHQRHLWGKEEACD